MGDLELVKEYEEKGSEEAFATLVSRHIDMVYSVALRQVVNPHHAQEITQAVFVILARKCATLGKGTILAGWLHRTTRLTALHSLRTEIRRAHREQEAYMQFLSNEPEGEAWNQMGPLLEEAIDGLREKERNAVVLRFLEGKGFREVGVALGTTEDAAQKLVSRATEKLRNYFVKRGIKVSAGVFVAVLTANSLSAAPTGLAGSVTTIAVVKGATAGPSSLTLIKGALKLMAWTKIKIAVVVGVGLLVAGGTTAVVVREVYPPEPTYQGKTLSKWLEMTYEEHYEGRTRFSTYTYDGRAHDAIRRMGKSSIPLLLKMCRDKSRVQQNRAGQGFWSLGVLAESAIPELSRLLQNRDCVAGAAQSLAGISPKSVPILISALNNRDAEIKVWAISALDSGLAQDPEGEWAGLLHNIQPPLGNDPHAAIDALIHCTGDRYKGFRSRSLRALGVIRKEPERVVPLLIQKLRDDPDGYSRRMAARSFGLFESDSNSAISALTEALQDSDADVRQAAKDAITKITTGTQ